VVSGALETAVAVVLLVAVIAGGLRVARREWRRWLEFEEPELDELDAQEQIRPHGNVLTLPKRKAER
jgi:hypothetical protein